MCAKKQEWNERNGKKAKQEQSMYSILVCGYQKWWLWINIYSTSWWRWDLVSIVGFYKSYPVRAVRTSTQAYQRKLKEKISIWKYLMSTIFGTPSFWMTAAWSCTCLAQWQANWQHFDLYFHCLLVKWIITKIKTSVDLCVVLVISLYILYIYNDI